MSSINHVGYWNTDISSDNCACYPTLQNRYPRLVAGAVSRLFENIALDLIIFWQFQFPSSSLAVLSIFPNYFLRLTLDYSIHRIVNIVISSRRLFRDPHLSPRLHRIQPAKPAKAAQPAKNPPELGAKQH